MILIEVNHADFVNIEGASRITIGDDVLRVERPDGTYHYSIHGGIQNSALVYHQIKEVQKRNGSI